MAHKLEWCASLLTALLTALGCGSDSLTGPVSLGTGGLETSGVAGADQDRDAEWLGSVGQNTATSPSCPVGQTQCGADCVTLAADPSNCGNCGTACSATQHCENGTCVDGTGGTSSPGNAGSGGGTGTTSTGGSGTATGGAGSGGTESGGASTGGTATGGAGNGGTETGGTGTGGTATGGASTGGTETRGEGTGGEGTGGEGTGGEGTGGEGTGGEGTGGEGTGGEGTGGEGTGGSGGCGIEPVNANSSDAVRNVLCYLYEIYGEYTLSGQQDCHWSASPGDLGVINQASGEYPAVVGGDFLYDNAVDQGIDSWNAGGLSMIRYHMGRPEDGDSYESSLSTTDLDDTLTPGTSRYSGLMGKFDHAANELGRLQDAGVVVLWAPFHESQPNGWFWWSKGRPEQVQELWRLMFDDFTARGLNNLVWLFPFSGSPDSAVYPGKAVVDIAGSDTYADTPPFSGMYDRTVGVVGDTIPIPLHETGNIPNPEDMFNGNAAPWVLFSAWCAEWLTDNSSAVIQQAYGHERTINRGDMPNFN